MYIETEELVPQAPVRQKKSRDRIRKAVDHLATGVVTTGGLLVIASIIGLFVLFVFVIAPLWRDAKVTAIAQMPGIQLGIAPDARLLAIDCDEYQQIGLLLTTDGVVQFYDIPTAQPKERFRLPLPAGATLTNAQLSPNGQSLAAGMCTGAIVFAELNYHHTLDGSQRAYSPAVTMVESLQLDSLGQPLEHLAVAGSPNANLIAVAITADRRLVLYTRTVETSLFGAGEALVSQPVVAQLAASPTALAIEQSLGSFYVGLENGALLKYDLQEPSSPRLVENVQAANAAITTLGFLIGERSLVVGDAQGGVNVWFESFDENGLGPRQLRKAHTLAGHRTAVRAFAPSQRNRTFLTGSEDGEIILHFATNQRVLYRSKLPGASVRFIELAPKADGALVVDAQQQILHLSIDNPHPEANWRAFFGKIWYEGYGKPDYVWQSSSGTDDFEAKLSLIPLIFGTLKGTFYALLFALPIGVLSALYVSQFMHPKLRGMVKPTMEIMAALPSVVLGFIAGLWLAPRVQPVVPGILMMLVAIPLVALLFGWLWQKMPKQWTQRLTSGAEIFLLVPVIVLAGWMCISASATIEHVLFGGDFRQWLLDTFRLSYDQRNAFVVGLVMGFAVVPIIFTISEDALSSVPASLTAASLALGATRWQTAVHVILPSASPGIFSAAMVGFGRAVGETMIVLMATGNTPVMDWNIFNGFRTLSATIAVEIPEAPVAGTLYRTLFLAALLLFIMTFIVNTAAEVIRQRMRLKYQRQ
ncbi:MAG: ABC transporter permease subunit [candidate division KSB1 bacterium]|nr:ABC transporter permease subunit [candidate division KSB1 bacterium]MDZ7301281.1 ABC transporter permease subunit [candidate division KSB1 bacterium]MDZ7310834.1 ABC transporter permease subunit [candidate division KSB1 bacterium]